MRCDVFANVGYVRLEDLRVAQVKDASFTGGYEDRHLQGEILQLEAGLRDAAHCPRCLNVQTWLAVW